MRRKYTVTLTEAEQASLRKLVTSGKTAARVLTRARVLLKAAAGESDPAIARALDVGLTTVYRARQRCFEEGVEAVITARRPKRDYRRKLDGSQEAHLVAVACSTPPAGQGRWTLRLLANRMVELEQVDSLSYETVRRALKKTDSSPG